MPACGFAAVVPEPRLLPDVGCQFPSCRLQAVSKESRTTCASARLVTSPSAFYFFREFRINGPPFSCFRVLAFPHGMSKSRTCSQCVHFLFEVIKSVRLPGNDFVRKLWQSVLFAAVCASVSLSNRQLWSRDVSNIEMWQSIARAIVRCGRGTCCQYAQVSRVPDIPWIAEKVL
jgi:hypothetical protein